MRSHHGDSWADIACDSAGPWLNCVHVSGQELCFSLSAGFMLHCFRIIHCIYHYDSDYTDTRV